MFYLWYQRSPSVKSANSQYCCPDRTVSRSNVLVITVHDGSRRPASAVLASKQGFGRTLGDLGLTDTSHLELAFLKPCYTCRHAHIPIRYHYLRSSNAPDGVCIHTNTHKDFSPRQSHANASFTQKIFLLAFPLLLRMYNEHACALNELFIFPLGTKWPSVDRHNTRDVARKV